METGICRLCGQRKDIVDSHVWPKFAYKRYASDLNKGGAFLDLSKKKLTNAQYTAYWFCEECDNETLSAGETHAGQLCAALDAQPTVARAYDHRLLAFVTSISWRSAMHHVVSGGVRDEGRLREAMRHWQQYLLGRKSRVEPFTQHLLVVYPTDFDTHKALGGQVFLDKHLLLSQIGPLLIVGLLGHKQLSVAPPHRTVTRARQYQCRGRSELRR